MSDKIKVLIVDDSAYSRQAIKGMLELDRDIEVVGIASNGIEAMAKTLKLKPDVITLDFEMPEMDGFSFLRWLMDKKPLPVIMVSSYSDKRTVFMALELGAVDFIAKPTTRASLDLLTIQDDLLEKVRGVRDLRMDRLSLHRNMIKQDHETVRSRRYHPRNDPKDRDIEIVTIGSSTGGPAALQIILTMLPADFPAAILISQHMPKGFTEPFANRLNKLSKIRVREAEEGSPVEKGTALVCPGGCHLALKGKSHSFRVALVDPAGGDRYTPSVDVMMTSVAEHFGPAAMGVVLTGMGNDGKKGVVEIKEKGGYTIAESEKTAVVFGMPQEAIKTGVIDRVLPLDEIPGEITRVVMAVKKT